MRRRQPARYAPAMRTRIAIVTVAAIAGALCGCDVPQAGSPLSAAPSFDAKCVTLPPSRFDVVAIPIRVAFDRTRSQRDLTGMYEQATARHLTMGLTRARIGHRATIAVNGLQEGGTGRVCMRADVRVELAAEPLTVFIARELDGDPCRQAAVREHEMQHVAVYEAVLAATPSALGRSLETALGGRRFDGASAAAVQAEVEAEVARHLDAFLDATGQAVRARQAAVDSPAEYARVSAACPGSRPP